MKRRGDDRKHVARVLAIGVECDMALLTVDEPEFWEGVQPVRFGPLPRLHVRVWALRLGPVKHHCKAGQHAVWEVVPVLGGQRGKGEGAAALVASFMLDA